MVYRVAIVGAGRMGQVYAEAYSAFPETEVVALVDPNEVCRGSPESASHQEPSRSLR
jgi:predicted dehydrogenase